MSPDLDTSIQAGADEAFADLDLVDLNVILHRADGEEKDATGQSAGSSFGSSKLTSQAVMVYTPSLTTEHSSTVVWRDG